MKKDYILISILTIIVIISVIYGLIVVGLPQDVRGNKFDSIRRSDLSNIKNRIDNFTISNKRLPQTIKEAAADASYIKLNDPDTGKQYEYYLSGTDNFKLCATFNTEYKGVQSPYAGDISNNYTTTSSDFIHPKGYFCFTFPAKYSYQNRYPTSTPKLQNINFTDKNISTVTTTTSYDQSSKFPEGFFSTDPDEFGLVNYKNQSIYLTVNFINPVKLSEITNTFNECKTSSCDSYSGVMLLNIEGETSDYQRISLGNNLRPLETGLISTVAVTSEKEFKKITFRTYGPLIWKKMKFTYK